HFHGIGVRPDQLDQPRRGLPCRGAPGGRGDRRQAAQLDGRAVVGGGHSSHRFGGYALDAGAQRAEHLDGLGGLARAELRRDADEPATRWVTFAASASADPETRVELPPPPESTSTSTATTATAQAPTITRNRLTPRAFPAVGEA